MPQDLFYNKEARSKMYAGVKKLTDAVKVTLGPKGRNVAINNLYPPTITSMTKDGVTVAARINLSDNVENMGAHLVKEAATQTAKLAGDGTTTATLLAQVLIEKGIEAIDAGANPINLKKGMDKAVVAVVKYLGKIAEPISGDFDKIRNIATVSANNDAAIAYLITSAMEKIGIYGYISMEESKNYSTTIEVVDGIHIEKGLISPYFINKPGENMADFENALILLHDRKISFLSDIQPVLQMALTHKRPLVIIAEDVDGEALQTMLINAAQQKLPFAAVKMPGFGEEQQAFLEDLAILTGGRLVSDQKGDVLADTPFNHLGQAKRITITQTSTVIKGGHGKKSEIETRIKDIHAQMENHTNDFAKERLRVRLARVSNSRAIMHVGAPTPVELKEQLMRIDDALRATRAAVEEGIIPGGGIAYLKAIQAVQLVEGDNGDEAIGISIVEECLQAPIRQILFNSGLDKKSDDIITRLTENTYGNDFGFNAKTEAFERFFETGIIDPVKVARAALEHAASVAGMFWLMECVIVDV